MGAPGSGVPHFYSHREFMSWAMRDPVAELRRPSDPLAEFRPKRISSLPLSPPSLSSSDSLSELLKRLNSGSRRRDDD